MDFALKLYEHDPMIMVANELVANGQAKQPTQIRSCKFWLASFSDTARLNLIEKLLFQTDLSKPQLQPVETQSCHF
jgi:hypothetical protein